MSSNACQRGTYVIPLGQTETDGIRAAPLAALAAGAVWRWSGDALRVDGPAELLVLGRPAGEADLRERAARSVRRLFGAKLSAGVEQKAAPDFPAVQLGKGFVVTDGHDLYAVTAIETVAEGTLLAFAGALPPKQTDLFVVNESGQRAPVAVGERRGVICFTPGTLIATPDGPRPVEAIRAGDRISTRDDGDQAVLWSGARRMSGARLYAMPYLRPIRIRAGAIGLDQPEGDLIVSPDHRMLIRGDHARALFNQPEVLVAARDLVDGRGILTETGLREVTYIHLMTERHEIVWANGLETESFHPASADLDLIEDSQRAALLDLVPGLREDPNVYGDYARRNLNGSEAAILRHEAA